jgi:hypothetical protein
VPQLEPSEFVPARFRSHEADIESGERWWLDALGQSAENTGFVIPVRVQQTVVIRRPQREFRLTRKLGVILYPVQRPALDSRSTNLNSPTTRIRHMWSWRFRRGSSSSSIIDPGKAA